MINMKNRNKMLICRNTVSFRQEIAFFIAAAICFVLALALRKYERAFLISCAAVGIILAIIEIAFAFAGDVKFLRYNQTGCRFGKKEIAWKDVHPYIMFMNHGVTVILSDNPIDKFDLKVDKRIYACVRADKFFSDMSPLVDEMIFVVDELTGKFVMDLGPNAKKFNKLVEQHNKRVLASDNVEK